MSQKWTREALAAHAASLAPMEMILEMRAKQIGSSGNGGLKKLLGSMQQEVQQLRALIPEARKAVEEKEIEDSKSPHLKSMNNKPN